MKQLYVLDVLIVYDLTWCELTFSVYVIWLDLSKIMIFVKEKKNTMFSSHISHKDKTDKPYFYSFRI